MDQKYQKENNILQNLFKKWFKKVLTYLFNMYKMILMDIKDILNSKYNNYKMELIKQNKNHNYKFNNNRHKYNQ